MSSLLIELKDDNKMPFVRDLLSNYDFVEIIEFEDSLQKKSTSTNLLELAGLWKNYDINFDDLRNKAWRRNIDFD